jgi:hypothetical protein
MKSTTAAVMLASALAACGSTHEPSGPSAVAFTAELSKAQPEYDAVAAEVVVQDIVTRVLPTLAPGTAFAALEEQLAALAAALLEEEDQAVLSSYVGGARDALRDYGAGAPESQEPELEGVEFALEYVAEGLQLPGSGGKGTGRRT